MSKYFTEIVYDLTKDEDFKKTIDDLNIIINEMKKIRIEK
jgi:hypothetical protein